MQDKIRTDSDKISVQVLGPFSASLRQQIVTPTAAKQRQILALLALRSGQVVTTSTLAEELWGCRLPRSFAATLQTYIFQLRRRLAAALPEGRDTKHFLSTRHSGYLLECQTDVEEFKRLARAGREAAEAARLRTASELLSHALTLWRGPALADIRQGAVLEVEAAALAQTRLGVVETRIEYDLALNRHNVVIGELVSLVAEHPLNENFCGLLMRAYYYSGHTAQALEEFRRLRYALNHELGLEPGPRLQREHQSILSGELTANVSDLVQRSPETDLDGKDSDTNKRLKANQHHTLHRTHAACPKYGDLASHLRNSMAHHQPGLSAEVPSSQHHTGANQAISRAARECSPTEPSKWHATHGAPLSPAHPITALSGLFLLQLIAVLGASGPSHPIKLAGSPACSAAVFALQVRNSSPCAGSWSARCRIAIIIAQAIATYLPTLAFNVIWPGMADFLAGSVLLLAPNRKGWIVFTAVVMSMIAAAIPPRLGTYSAALETVTSLATGLAAFGLSRLAALVRQAYAVRAELV